MATSKTRRSPFVSVFLHLGVTVQYGKLFILKERVEAMALETELKYFNEHKAELASRFPGKFVVVKGESAAGGFQTIQEALGAGARQFGMESFLVRRTDEAAQEVSIPALTLGILSAHPNV